MQSIHKQKNNNNNNPHLQEIKTAELVHIKTLTNSCPLANKT